MRLVCMGSSASEFFLKSLDLSFGSHCRGWCYLALNMPISPSDFQNKTYGPIMGTSNSTFWPVDGLGIVSCSQITRVNISSFRIKFEMQKLQELKVKIVLFK
jgi:hypothetical protein